MKAAAELAAGIAIMGILFAFGALALVVAAGAGTLK